MIVIFSASPRVPVALFPGQYLILLVLLIFTILGHAVISHCSFNLHFLDDKRCWALVCAVTDHSYCFACEMSIQLLFCPYFNLVGLFVFPLLNCRSHCVFWMCPLSNVLQVFVVCVFILMVSFDEHQFLIWVSLIHHFSLHGSCFLGSV